MPRPFRACIPVFLCALLAFGVLFSGCGGDSTTGPPTQNPTSVGGNVNKAAIVGASVTIHKLNSDGSINPTVVAGPFTTNASGNFTGTIPAGVSGPFAMVSTGGSYTDEATGATVSVPAGRELHGIYQTGSCAVTPLSDATFQGMQALVAGGTPLSAAITQAISTTTTAFGFNFTTTTPDTLGAGVGQKEYAALLGGISRLLNANPALSAFASTPPFDLVLALTADLGNGLLDGLNAAGNAIMVPTDATGTTTAAWPALSATNLSAWLTEANAYAASVPSLSGISFPTNAAWNPAATGGGGGGGGSAGTITFGGTGVNFLPATTCSPDSNYVYGGSQLVWYDRAKHVEITAVPGTVAGTIQTLYVVHSPYVWTVYSGIGIGGIVRSGGTTTFTNANVNQLSPTGSSNLTLTGTLTDPVGYGNVAYTSTTIPAGTAVTDSLAIPASGTYKFFDRAKHIEIRIVLADQGLYPGKIQTIFFIQNASLVWTAHGVSGIADADISGTQVTLANVALVDINNSSSLVYLTGALYTTLP